MPFVDTSLRTALMSALAMAAVSGVSPLANLQFMAPPLAFPEAKLDGHGNGGGRTLPAPAATSQPNTKAVRPIIIGARAVNG